MNSWEAGVKNRTLSDIKGESTLRAFAQIIDPLCNIAEDPETREMIVMERKPEQRDKTAYMLQQAYKVLATHEDDFCAVMAVCHDCTAEEYKAGLTYGQAIEDFSTLISDEVWRSFFGMAQRHGERSISAQENTEAQTN